MSKTTNIDLAKIGTVRSTFLPAEVICPTLDRLDAFLSGLDAAGVLEFRLSINEQNALPEVLAFADEVFFARQACGAHF